jgi:hypothetical protein
MTPTAVFCGAGLKKIHQIEREKSRQNPAKPSNREGGSIVDTPSYRATGIPMLQMQLFDNSKLLTIHTQPHRRATDRV